MEYVKVKDNKIVQIVDTDDPKKLQNLTFPQGKWLIDRPLPEKNDVHTNDDIREFTPDWKTRPVTDLIADGFLQLRIAEETDEAVEGTVLEKIEDGKIVKKTRYDLAKEGAIKLGYNEAIDEQAKTVVSGSSDELYRKKLLDREEYLKRLGDDARIERDSRINTVGWRYERYTSEQRLGLPTTDSIDALDLYVQRLRDVPQQEGFPENIVWPTPPEPKKTT